MPVHEFDPFRGYKYTVQIDPTFDTKGGFNSVTGLRAETEMVEYREGSDPGWTRKLPGMTSFDNLVFKKGISVDSTFEIWHSMVKGGFEGGEIPDGGIRRTITISLKDRPALSTVKQWIARECWPTIYEVDELQAQSSDVLIETLELVVEFVDILSVT